MYTFIKSKPRAGVIFKPPADDKIFLHSGESRTAFEKAIQLQNFLAEMMKFFPNYKQEGFATGVEKTFTLTDDAGNVVGTFDPALQDPTQHEVTGWGNVYTRGYYPRDVMEPGFATRYGDSHANYVGGKYWGYGAGKAATNLNFQPWAGEYNHFKDLTPDGWNNPLDVSAYASTLYEGYGAAAPALSGISLSEWSNAQSYLNANFSGKSFYEIVVTGIQNSDIGTVTAPRDYLGDVEVMDWNNITHHGGFLYDGKADVDENGNGTIEDGERGKGAYYLMLSMLESRRRINYGMSYVFGSPFNIIDNNYMLEHISNMFNNPDELGRLNAQNRRVFEAFFGAQHTLRGMLAAYCGGYDVNGGGSWEPADEVDGLNHFEGADSGGFSGGNAYLDSALDEAAFQRFRHWIYNNVIAYKDSLSGSEEDAVQLKLDEWLGNIEQPYLSNEAFWSNDELDPARKVGYKTYLSWDRFSLKYTDGTNPYYLNKLMSDGSRQTNLQPGINPLETNYRDYHNDYSVNQILNLSHEQVTGRALVEGQNLYQTNWVVYTVGSFYDWYEDIVKQNMEAVSLTNMDRKRYHHDMNAYRKWKVEMQDKEYEDQRNESIAEKKRNERKRAEKVKQKFSVSNDKNKHKNAVNNSNKTNQQPKKNDAAEFAKNFQKLNVMMMKRIAQAGKERAKRSKEAANS